MLLEQRLAGRIHVTDDDARAAYARFISNITNANKSVELEVANFPVAQRALAAQVVAQARAGRSLCVLAPCDSRGFQELRATTHVELKL